MLTMNVSKFKKNLNGIINKVINSDEPIKINTEDGNVIIMSEEKYKGYLETLYLTSIPNMKESLLEGKNTPIDELINSDKVEF